MRSQKNRNLIRRLITFCKSNFANRQLKLTAIAFLLLTNSDHSPEAWPLNIALYHVVRKAVNENRRERQQSIEQLIKEWEAAR